MVATPDHYDPISAARRTSGIIGREPLPCLMANPTSTIITGALSGDAGQRLKLSAPSRSRRPKRLSVAPSGALGTLTLILKRSLNRHW
jgi:hypothetical protein